MNEKKVVNRRVFIGLEIVCIILIACLVGATSLYSLQINDKDNTISSLNSEVSNLNSTLNLGKSTDWVQNQIVSQPAGAYSSWTFSVQYAGYVSVWVFSDTNNTYVRVIYTCAYVPILHYDNQINVGTSDTAVFSVLPSSGIEIRVGNTNTVNNATETIAHIEYTY